MCRSIKDLRRLDHDATDEETFEAARQYVRKISGYREPSQKNREAFERAISEIQESSRRLLDSVTTA